MTDLLPCPFCGGEAEMYVFPRIPSGWNYWPRCKLASCCGHLFKKYASRDAATEGWNRRAEPEDTRQRVIKEGKCPMCVDCPDGCPLETPKDPKNDGRFAEPYNRALTVEELLKMDGEPIWAVDGEGHKSWVLVNAKDKCCADSEFGSWQFYFYNMRDLGPGTHLHRMGWVAYKQKLMEE